MAINWEAPIEIRDGRNGNWFWVDKEIWEDNRLTSSDKVLYGTVAYFSNQKSQSSFPSIESLQKHSGLSRRQTYRSIKSLEGFQHIEINRKSGKPNEYTLLDNGINHLKEQRGANLAPVQPLHYPGGAKSDIGGVPNVTYEQELTNKNKELSKDNSSETRPNGHARCPLTLKEKYPELCTRYLGGHAECIEFINSAGEDGRRFPNYTKQIGHLHSILRAGFDFDDINKVISQIEKDRFWKERGWDFATISNEIGKVKSNG